MVFGAPQTHALGTRLENATGSHVEGAGLEDLVKIYASMCPEVEQTWPDFYIGLGARSRVDLAGTGLLPL